MYLHCHLDDDELFALIKEGRESALALVYKKYWQRLYTAAYSILKDGQACEDIIQEIFLTLWLKRKEITIQVSLLSYLHASVRYEVYRQIKSGRVRAVILDHIFERLHAQPDYNSCEYKELQSQIGSFIEQLPDKCKTVYKLSRESQLSHKQIATQLNISSKTVENHLTKALGFLRISLAQLLTVEIILLLINNYFHLA